ncbi:MAG: hypothetical protein AB7U95_26740 [Reyranella sp.]
MSLLVEGSAGTPVRRFVVTSVRGARLSPGLLLAVAGLPVLAAAGALLTTPVILSKAMTQDLLFNLAGAWHVHAGHVQHVDFHDPTGRLSFILTAIGFRLVGAIPFAILVNVAIVAAILFAASFVATVRRLPLLPAAIFVVFVSLLALMPVNVGERPDQYTFAMSYNRYCWSAYSILALILLVPPRDGADRTSLDVGVAGLLLVLMFSFKITYFAAGLATVGFAVLFHPHVSRRWRMWLALSALLVGNALAPYNEPYLGDVLGWAGTGAVRRDLMLHLNNFMAALGQYAPYLVAIVVAGWMWWSGRAPWRLPLTLIFLFAVSLLLLSQNSQVAGLPSGIVMLLVLYDRVRAHFAAVRNRDMAPLLLALLVPPLFVTGSFAMSLAGYHAAASKSHRLYVVDHTNLRGLAVPAHRTGTFVTVSHAFDYPTGTRADSATPLYRLSDYEYLVLLLEAADLMRLRPPGGIAVLDNVNPLPFMLGQPPIPGANLWSGWNAPVRTADEYLGGIRYVLIPKFPVTPQWTADLKKLYGRYLDDHFHPAAETRGWILLDRSPPRL